MLPDRVSNPGPLTYESGALPIALRGPAAITPKAGKPELWFMCSARRLMVFNVCVNFHENISSGFKVLGRTRNLLTHKGQ